MTAAALVAHGVAAVQRGRGGYVAALSERANRHVYARGLRVRRGFADHASATSSTAPATTRITSPRRRKLVTDHEDVHVWQGRWFGPAVPRAVRRVDGRSAAPSARVVWAVRRRGEPFGKVVETCAYYLNPFEWWAYSRDGHWPPTQKVAGLGWRRPCVRPFSERPRAAGPSRSRQCRQQRPVELPPAPPAGSSGRRPSISTVPRWSGRQAVHRLDVAGPVGDDDVAGCRR